MEINIFSSEKTDRKIAVRRHLFTLLLAVVINLVIWFFQSIGLPDEDGASGLYTTIMDIVATCFETIILMEASFAVSRLVIRYFWKVKFSFASILFQNVILLLSVVLLSATISAAYAVMYPDSSWLSWDVFICDCLVAYFLTSVFFTAYLTNRYREEKALTQQATIDKLKLKTDNHFVFNSLATLGNLIQTDPEAAVEFNNSMSRMYRYIVSKGDASVVSLSEELDFMKEYKKNLSVRHDSISLCIEKDLYSLDSYIPPLTLQGLVENAVKHNRHSISNRLTITIEADPKKNYIIVSNNRLPLSRTLESSKSGLSTLGQRYQAICGKSIIIESDENCFKVSLPIISYSDLS